MHASEQITAARLDFVLIELRSNNDQLNIRCDGLVLESGENRKKRSEPCIRNDDNAQSKIGELRRLHSTIPVYFPPKSFGGMRRTRHA